MQKAIFILLSSLLYLNVFGQEKDLPSKITHVTVYPRWAYITRTSTVQVTPGTSVWVIRNLPSWVDEESVRVQLLTKSKCSLNGTTVKTVFLKQVKDEEIQKKQKELQEFKDQLEDTAAERNAFEKSQNYLNNLVQWGKEKIGEDFKGRKVDINEYEDFKSFIEKSQLNLTKKFLNNQRIIRESQPKLNALENEMNLLHSQSNLEQKEIHIEVSASEPAEITLKAQYLISGASWYPIYSAWAKGSESTVTIQCEAIVQQSTGENWENAQFTLSTIRPDMVVVKPELKPWYVNAKHLNDKENVPQTTSEVGYQLLLNNSRSAGNGQIETFNSLQNKQKAYSKINKFSEEALQSMDDNASNFTEVLRQIEERGTSLELQVQGNYSLLPNGRPIKMEVSRSELKIALHYSASPSLSKNTYVSGEIQNTSSTPFLPGAVRVYREGSFIGKSKFNFVAEGEYAEIYMGLEDRIKVTKTLDVKNSATTYFKNKKVLKLGYQIDVQNYLDRAIQIEIQDQIPVSQDQDTKVKTLLLEPKPKSQEKGITIWDVSLQSQEKKSINFEFQLEYPEEMKLINGMELEKQLQQNKK